jgi:NADPH-dependent curcumin reductase CurA
VYSGREIRLAARPRGNPVNEDFALAVVQYDEPAPGQVLVRNYWMSLDPGTRARMDGGPSYAQSFTVGSALDGSAVGEVIASACEGFVPGDLVVHRAGWRELALLQPGVASSLPPRHVRPDRVPLQAHLGALGHTGFSAYVGLFEAAAMRPDDVVFVSAAAGAVGSVAGQLARLRGHQVVGSAGSDAKVRHIVDDLGFDAAFNYHDLSVAEQLHRVCPDGIDLYFDNVGGEHLEAAVGAMRDHGRVALCGSVSTYNGDTPKGLRNEFQIVSKRLNLRGFLIADHLHMWDQFLEEVTPLVTSGRLVQRESVVDGLESAPAAFIRMLAGGNLGKSLVRLAS